MRQEERELKLIMHFVVDVKCIFYPPATLVTPVLVRSGSNVSFSKRENRSIFRYN